MARRCIRYHAQDATQDATADERKAHQDVHHVTSNWLSKKPVDMTRARDCLSSTPYVTTTLPCEREEEEAIGK